MDIETLDMCSRWSDGICWAQTLATTPRHPDPTSRRRIIIIRTSSTGRRGIGLGEAVLLLIAIQESNGERVLTRVGATDWNWT